MGGESDVLGWWRPKGVAGSGLWLGIAGTALGLLNNGGLNGLFGNNRCGCNCQQQFVTKQEFDLGQQLAANDSEIGLLRADKYTDQKIIKAIPVRIGDTEIMLRMENIEEIANAARRME